MKNLVLGCEPVNKGKMVGPPTHSASTSKATHWDTGGRLLNERPGGSPERTGRWGQGLKQAGEVTSELLLRARGCSMRKKHEETDPENHTALLFNGTSNPL